LAARANDRYLKSHPFLSLTRAAAVLGDELDARDRAIWRGAPLGVPRQYSSHVVIVVMVVVMIVMNVMMMIVMVVMVLLGEC
jgi:hypothetical protein